MPVKSIVLLVLFMTLGLPASSEVFRWTDENGQVHFSDQARAPSAAKAVEIDTSKMNITSELSTPEQLQRIAEEKDMKRQQEIDSWKAKLKNKPKKEDWCTWARNHLKTIVGRVVFLDDNNQPVQVSEKEREARAKQLSQDIQTRCN